MNAVDTSGTAPLSTVHPVNLPLRTDQVHKPNSTEAILKNAPDKVENFFAVPKIVE